MHFTEIKIQPLVDAFERGLAPVFEGIEPDKTEENIQSRIRGTLLMAMSNKLGAIVVTAGNKSEMATGYATLYGDMAGGFAVIKDIVKTRSTRTPFRPMKSWTQWSSATWRKTSRPSRSPRRVSTSPPCAKCCA